MNETINIFIFCIFSLPTQVELTRRDRMKIQIFVIFLLAFLASFVMSNQSKMPVNAVAIPRGCAEACPPDGGKKICAKNPTTNKLGTFMSDCFLGRYNSCSNVDKSQSECKYSFFRFLILIIVLFVLLFCRI